MNEIIGSKIERIDELGSSNNYAATQLLTKRLPEGIIFVANSQVDGRGQVSNRWESEPNKNLTFSILLYPDFLEIMKQFEISKAISLGVVDFLKELTDHVSTKWPNDIYIGTKKVAGILIENSIRIDKISSCIVGIGLNINQKIFVSDAPNPVSLTHVTGLIYNLEESLSQLCQKIDVRYHQLRNGDFRQIDDDYIEMLYQLGNWSLYSDENGDFEGKIIGVDQIGRLMIEMRDGNIKKYHFKEVVFK
ncbi:MAG TPA: biotin--[acetyl-CoA-carboxylase] ligase [Prolixibacteraceae bacterium]|nr:biotin--[acetyl-CoA-carboxylase] ligase [Prolixibacteraceae bacterium]